MLNPLTREMVLKRDKYQCQICGRADKKLHVHHINYTNDDPKNLITLCAGCHAKQKRNGAGVSSGYYKYKSVNVKDETYARLCEMGKYGESMDDILNRILDWEDEERGE